MEAVETFADRLSNAYSTDNYRDGWSSCIRALRKHGLNDRQIEAVIRSKWTRWAADSSGKAYGRNTGRDLISFMDHDKLWSEVEALTVETFGATVPA